MEDLLFIKNYIDDEELRKSFYHLAEKTFNINYDNWYKEHLWNEKSKYINYSYFKGKNIVSNISVNEFDLVINGQIKKCIQLGTVMTSEEYRNQGLNRKLMNKIFKDYDDKCAFYYLFANETVLNFYPKFGFKRTKQKTFSIEGEKIDKKDAEIRKLNIYKDKGKINDYIFNRVEVSKKLGVINDIWPLKVYCYKFFSNNLYYLKEDQCIVILDRDNSGNVTIYDILSKKEFNFENILEKIITKNDKRINIGFIPDLNKYTAIIGEKDSNDDALFMKNANEDLEILFPITSQT